TMTSSWREPRLRSSRKVRTSASTLSRNDSCKTRNLGSHDNERKRSPATPWIAPSCCGTARAGGWRNNLVALRLGTLVRATALFIACGAALVVWGRRSQFGSEAPSLGHGAPMPPRAEAFGLPISDPRAFPGYTLLVPIQSKTTYLIDMHGMVVHTWES